MATRKFKLRKKRYGKTNRGATYIHNVMVDMIRKREADKKASEKANENSVKKSEVDALKRELKKARDEAAALRMTSKQKAASVENQEEKNESVNSEAEAAFRRAFVKSMLGGRNKQSYESPDEPSRAVRWLGFWLSMALMFLGIHLMKESSWSWFWFVPMLLPFLGVLQIESERPIPLGLHSNLEKKPGRLVRFFDIWSASIIAFVGIYLMIKFSTDWYWFIPFLILFLVLLPQKMKEWEKEDEEKKIRKAERKAQREEWRASSPLWKFVKIVFWLGILWLVWQWVGFYLWMFVLGLAR